MSQNKKQFLYIAWAEFKLMDERIQNPTLCLEKWNFILNVFYLLLMFLHVSFSCAYTTSEYKIIPECKVRRGLPLREEFIQNNLYRLKVLKIIYMIMQQGRIMAILFNGQVDYK